METTIVCWGNVGIMEQKVETTIETETGACGHRHMCWGNEVCSLSGACCKQVCRFSDGHR